MKTTTSINRKDIIAIIAVIILFALMMPLKAANGNNANADLNEIQTASVQLGLFNSEIEKAVEYTAPVLSENFEVMAAESELEDMFGSVEKNAAYSSPSLKSESFELASAETKLEDIFGSVAKSAEYTSPKVNENFEVADAIQNLENINSQLEQSVRYTPSVI